MSIKADGLRTVISFGNLGKLSFPGNIGHVRNLSTWKGVSSPIYEEELELTRSLKHISLEGHNSPRKLEPRTGIRNCRCGVDGDIHQRMHGARSQI